MIDILLVYLIGVVSGMLAVPVFVYLRRDKLISMLAPILLKKAQDDMMRGLEPPDVTEEADEL